MKKSALISLALALGFGSLAYAEPPGDVQDPRKQPPKKDHFGQWLDDDGFVTPGPKIKNFIDSDEDRIDDRFQPAAGKPAGKQRPEVEKPEKPDPRVEEYRNQELGEYRNLEKALEGSKAWSDKAERDLDVKIAELRKKVGGDFDENEAEFAIKKARSEHEAAVAGHAGETKHIEDRLAEAKNDLVAKYEKLEKWLEGHKAEAAKAERDLDVKIAELRKNPDEREVAIAVKEARSKHEANMAGHAVERKNLESQLAELKRPEVVICIFPPRPFPPHWGKPPLAQTKDLRPLPGDFGTGSSTLAHWVERNIKADREKADKPKPEPKRPPVVRPPAPPRPEISKETKADLAEIEKDKADLFKAMREELGKLEKGSTKEDVRKAVEAFKEENADKFAEIKAASDKVHEELKAKRPERKKRPEPPAEVKTKIADVKKAEKQIHQARRSVSNELKKAQDELAAKIAEAKKNPDKREVAIEIKNLVAEQAAARKAALDAFKESQKEKHKELKAAQKDLRETIRATKEEGASRTSR